MFRFRSARDEWSVRVINSRLQAGHELGARGAGLEVAEEGPVGEALGGDMPEGREEAQARSGQRRAGVAGARSAEGAHL